MLTAPIGTYILTPMCILYPGTAPGRVCFFTFVFYKKIDVSNFTFSTCIFEVLYTHFKQHL